MIQRYISLDDHCFFFVDLLIFIGGIVCENGQIELWFDSRSLLETRELKLSFILDLFSLFHTT